MPPAHSLAHYRKVRWAITAVAVDSRPSPVREALAQTPSSSRGSRPIAHAFRATTRAILLSACLVECDGRWRSNNRDLSDFTLLRLAARGCVNPHVLDVDLVAAALESRQFHGVSSPPSSESHRRALIETRSNRRGLPFLVCPARRSCLNSRCCLRARGHLIANRPSRL